jgi:hypothetical protein
MRSIDRKVENPLPFLSELDMHCDFAEDDRAFGLNVHVRICPALNEVGGRDFKFGPVRAYLKINLSGAEPGDAVRYNDSLPEPAEVVETDLREKNTGRATNSEASLSGDTDPTGLLPSAGARLSYTRENSNVSKQTTATTTRRTNKLIKARPGLRWEIESRNSADPDAFLDDTYANGQRFLNANVRDGANGIAAESLLYCRKKDFAVVAVNKKVSDGFLHARNKEAVMALVLVKAIKGAEIHGAVIEEEHIFLSRCTIRDAD